MVFYDNILARAREKEYKDGIKYNQKDGTFYNICKWIYILAFAFTMVMNLLYISGMIMRFEDLKSGMMYYLITPAVMTVVLIGCLILSKFNENYIVASVFGAVNLLSAVVLCVIFAYLMKDDVGLLGLSASFYWRHLIPLVILAVCSAIMALIVVNSYLKTKKSYNRVLEILYDEYNSFPDDKPDWEEFVKNYKF